MRVQLICENVGFDDIEFELYDKPLILGRSLRSDVQIVHPLISRFHCEWRLSGGDLVLRDLESTNHTLINGDAVEQAVLQPGDRILLGDVLYIVDFEEIRAEHSRSVAEESSNPGSDPESTATHFEIKSISSPSP